MLQAFRRCVQAAAFGLPFAMLVLAIPAQVTAQPAEPPTLELTSPFSGTPQSLDGSASGEFLVTTASSRILTLWSRYSETRWQPRVIHAPPRDEYASGGYVGAISPDGKYIAFAVPPLSDGRGGYQPGTARIYMIERASQQLITTFSAGIPTRISRLRFSQDGNYLAGMLAQGCGVRLWAHRQWTTPNRDQAPDFADDDGYGGTDGVSACCPGTDMSACEALPKGTDVIFTGVTDGSAPWMVTLSENGVRTYVRPDQQQPRRAGSDFIAPRDMRLDRPARMAMSPDGMKLAVGDLFRPQIAILARDGVRFRWSASQKIPDEILSPDGKAEIAKNGLFLAEPVWARSGGRLLLYAFGYLPSGAFLDAPAGSNANRIAIFDPEAGGVEFVSLGIDTDTSLYAWQLAQSPTPIFFISPHALSAIDVGAQSPRIIADRIALDLRGNDDDWTLKLNTQRKQLYLSSPAGDSNSVALEFDYGEMRIGDVRYYASPDDMQTDVKGHDSAHGYYDADKKENEWRFKARISDPPVPAFFGTPLSLENLYPNEVSYSGAKLPSQNIAVWGTSRALRVIDGDGTIACSRPIGSPAFRMNITPDGRMAIVGHGDGTIRWYRLGDPKEACLPLIASLYLTRNQDRTWGFLAWLPNGKFMTSGGAALKDLACYPVGSPDNLGPCIDFQETDMFFSPADVRRALAGAESTEPQAKLANVVAAKSQEKASSLDLKSKLTTGNPNLPITFTMAGLDGGPRYLTLVAGAGYDLPFTVNGTTYSQAQPYRIDAIQTLEVVAKLPPNVLHRTQEIKICAVVSSRQDVNANSRVRLSGEACKGVTWTGNNSPPSKHKLWALLVGFSRAPKDLPQLQYAHADAINFARFLQRDSKGDLPGTGKSYFNEVDIRLLVSAEQIDGPALIQDPRIKTLLADLGDSRFHLLPRESGKYVDTVRSALRNIIDEIKHRPNKADWQDEILVYFSGHGFSKYVDDDHPYTQVGLVTPDSSPSFDSGVLWVDSDLAADLRTSNLVTLLIIDACSAQIDKDNDASSERIQLKIFSGSPIEGQTELQFLLGSALGRYSYEQQDYAIDDFVPGLALWPAGIGTKGSGVFSLGLLASLLCQEAIDQNQYTFDSSSRFLKNQFFTSANAKWYGGIRPKLETMMQGRFVTPDPIAFGYPGGGIYSPTLRSGSPAAPSCGFAKK
jgi:hypothetical protein